MKDSSNSANYKGLNPDEFMKKWLILGPISIFKDDKDQGEELQKKAKTWGEEAQKRIEEILLPHQLGPDSQGCPDLDRRENGPGLSAGRLQGCAEPGQPESLNEALHAN